MDTVMEQETLAAFVDGALSPEESARVVLHLADCADDAAYVDALMELNALLGAAFAAPVNQAIPERIRAAIFPAPASVGRARASGRSGWRMARPGGRRIAAWAAVAAAAALVVGVGIDLRTGGDTVQIAGAPGADGALRAALEAAPSGEAPSEGEERITLIATYRDAAGRPCREYEILHDAERALTRGLACRNSGEDWETEVAVASRLPSPAAGGGEGFVPAQGAASDTLDAALDRLGIGMSLTPDEERALIGSDWVE
ncbi:zf-HC2 domain-containing protein [Amaricoccus sp.]|uniref:zf-HC2 domain-containing protein n=1 Tax=Amaricoccus sp. TaxID=1872485 RepID=UPI001B44206B|nr:zf-HC2 domain-containing protein [Amaricoccus sp.]MBP7001583.1 zf-HC2 domain-containing protein [Amaricoccus sp.]